jgi:toxin ParE1/3/4
MARFRISGPARADLEHILATSLERWGEAGRARYAALIATAMRSIAGDPKSPTTRDRPELSRGVRSMHMRQARGSRSVKDPVHVIYYRTRDNVVEVVRVLHERMEPTLHIGTRTSRRR